MTGDGSAAQVGQLLRVLRRYADGPLARPLSDSLADLAAGEVGALAAFPPGSEDRQVEAVLGMVHQLLAVIVLDLRLEIGRERLAAAEWAQDVSPDDFGASS